MNKQSKERRLSILLSSFESYLNKNNMLDFWRTSSNSILPSTLRYANNREVSRDIEKLRSKGFIIKRQILNSRLGDYSFQKVYYCFRGKRRLRRERFL